MESKDLAWLTQSDEKRLVRLVSRMKFEDESLTNRKNPLVLAILLKILKTMDLSKPLDLLEATALTTGRDGLLRGGEVASEIITEQVQWRRSGAGKRCYRLHLLRTKTVRTGKGVDVDVGDYASAFSSAKLLERWISMNHLEGKPKCFLFPRVTRGSKFDWSKSVTTDWLRKVIKKRVASIGLDPRQFSAHSLRAGGATDLFMQRLPFYVIQKAGRWLSDAALVYYRADEDVLDAVAEAFGSQCKEGKF
jgi:hypothetical protein